MATGITTSTASYATRGGRHTGVTSAGVDWAMQYNLANTRMEFWYSTDDGATWSEATSLRVTLAANRAENHEFYIGEHDRAAFASCGSGGYVIQYVPLLTTTATWTSLQSNTTQDTDYIRVKVFDYGTLSGTPTYVILAFEANLGGELDWWSYQRRVSDDSAYSEQRVAFSTFGDVFDFDFQHNGDGKTAVTNPAIYIVYRYISGNRTYFQRRAWNNTQRGWSTTDSFRTMSTTAAADTDALCGVFDGTRFVMSWIDDGSDLVPTWKERDAADTVTTTRTVPALSDGAITSLSLTFDGDGDTRLYGVGTTSDDISTVTYDRTLGTFGTWSTLIATTATDRTVSVQPGYQGDGINAVWTAGTGPTYSVFFDRDPFNSRPTTPTWVSPPLNSAANVGASLTIAWVFNDPDDGDTQSAYRLERQVNGGTLEFYNAGSGTWTTGSEVSNPTSSQSVTLASGWASDGDVVLYKVKTEDQAGASSPWTARAQVVGSVPVAATLSSPADAATITSNTIGTVEWSSSEQTAYRVRLLTSADVVLYDSGKVTGTETSVSPSTILADGLTGAKVEVRVWNDEDLESATPDVHTFTVDYVPPATPTIVAVADPANGRNTVTVTNPAATGDQPEVTSHDLFVRVAAGGRTVGERTTDTDGIRIIAADPATVLHDYKAGSGHVFQYKVRANASANGTSADSAWSPVPE